MDLPKVQFTGHRRQAHRTHVIRRRQSPSALCSKFESIHRVYIALRCKTHLYVTLAVSWPAWWHAGWLTGLVSRPLPYNARHTYGTLARYRRYHGTLEG